MKNKILLLISCLFLLQSCMIYDMLYPSAYEEPFLKEEGNVNIAPVEENTGSLPLLITGGIINDKLYAGLPNDITIHVEGGSTEHLEVFANSGRLDTVDKKQGKYTFTEKVPGFVAEIVAKDPVSGKLVAGLFDVVTIPAPDAYIWKYKTPFKGQINFTAEQFKQQNAVVLQHDNINVPVRCVASSYTIIRIDGTGNRKSCENATKTGTFSDEGKKLIAEATKGDVYIFKSIKSDCSPMPVKDIVYVIE